MAKNADLSWLLAKHVELTDKLSHVKSKHAAEAIVSDDLKSVASACKRLTKCAENDASMQRAFYHAFDSGTRVYAGSLTFTLHR